MGSREALDVQQTYYDERAPEYDDWWQRRGRYDLGVEHSDLWRSDIEQLESWLDGLGPLGRCLELAAGTGNWTRQLVERSTGVVAVDGSAPALDVARAKLASHRGVEFVVADLFDWSSPETFDTVFFSFWLSHVPAERRADHWDLVRSALAPGGRVVMIDNAHPERVARSGFSRIHGPDHDPGTGREQRTLTDGRSFEIVKYYWTPADLVREAGEFGVRLEAAETRFWFLHAAGSIEASS